MVLMGHLVIQMVVRCDQIDGKTIECKDWMQRFVKCLHLPFLLQESVDAKGVGCDANAEVEGRGGVLCQVRNHQES